MSAQTEREMRDQFEAWYSTHAFSYTRDSIGSRDCSLQWDAWKAAMNTRATSATSAGVDEVARDAVIDAERMNAVFENSWDLRCFNTFSGEDVGWRIIEHYMTEPAERVIAEVFVDDPRKAIDMAISIKDNECCDVCHEPKGDSCLCQNEYWCEHDSMDMNR